MKSLPQEKLSASASRWPVLITAGVCFSLVVLVWFVFGQTLGFNFVNVDDSQYVLKNPAVARGLTRRGLIWAFTHSHAGNWHPFTWISHMIDCEVFGLKPGGHHFTNVLLHSATAVALFLALRKMTRALWPSAFAVAIFAVHPLRAESVAWVAERKDVLSGFFLVLTILAYVCYTHRQSRGSYLLTLALFVAGLLSKPMLVSLPFVLLLLDYWPLDRFGKRARVFVEKIPMFICALALGIATLFAQRNAIIDVASVPVAIRIGNAVTSCWIYLRQTFWPVDLAAFYPFPPNGVSIPALIFSLLALIGFSLAVVRFRSRKYLVTAWLWFLIMLLPVIGLVQVGEQSHADRYTYLPQIGLLIGVVWAITDLTSSWPRARFVLGPVAAILLVAFVVDARTQTSYWKNGETLWRHALAVTPDNPVARRNIGQVLQETGRPAEAIANYRRALEFDPTQALVRTNWGVILLEQGNQREAVEHFEAALKIQPKYVEAESNLGLALSELGRGEDAIVHLQRALEIDPDFADAHYNLGTSFLTLDRFAESVAEYKKAIDLNPADERALNNLAWILSTSPQGTIRDGKEAIAYAARADALTDNKNPVITATLAAAYAESGRFPEAVKTAERAIDLAAAEGNLPRADSIRAQLEFYQKGAPFRTTR